jgi:hypothetical protein
MSKKQLAVNSTVLLFDLFAPILHAKIACNFFFSRCGSADGSEENQSTREPSMTVALKALR